MGLVYLCLTTNNIVTEIQFFAIFHYLNAGSASAPPLLWCDRVTFALG